LCPVWTSPKQSRKKSPKFDVFSNPNLPIDHIIRVGGVSNSIGSSQQHLEGDVGDLVPHVLQPLPGALVKEPHGNVESGATPVFCNLKHQNWLLGQ